MPQILPHQKDQTTPTASSNASSRENQFGRGEASAAPSAAAPLPITQDREHVDAYVYTLTGSTDTPIAWRLIPPARHKGRMHARNLWGTVEECWDQLVAANRDGYGIFAMVQATDGNGFKGSNVTGFRAAFVEDDSGTLTWESVRAAGLAPSFVVRSKAGLHVYFKIAPGEDVSDCKPLLRALAAKLGTDPNVADTARVLRVPAFAHTKGEEPFDVRIVPEACDPEAVYTVRQIVDALQLETGPAPARGSKTKKTPGASAGPSPANDTGPAAGPSPTAGPAPTNDTAPPPPTDEFFTAAKAHAADPGRTSGSRPFKGAADNKVRPLKIRRAMFERYLAKAGPAIQGEGGDAKTFQLARVGRDFDLPPDVIHEAMKAWNATCVPPWTDEELADKIARAGQSAESEAGSKCAAPDGESATEDEPMTSMAAKVYGWLKNWTDTLLGHAGAIRLNIRSGHIQIGDHVIDLDIAIERAQRNLGEVPESIVETQFGPRVASVPNSVFFGQLLLLANENKFDPFRDALDALPAWDGTDRIPALLAALNLQAPSPIHATFLRKTMISAVARTHSPGCKVDTMLILHADKGGERKSTFFSTLFGAENFSDDQIDVHAKDTWLAINRHACHEWAELAGMMSARSAEGIKAFLSRRIDNFRLPYGRQVKDFPRISIFVGSTNNSMLFENDGGLRRYWVIPNIGKVDLAAVRDLRTQLWAQAVAEYRAGVTWWLDDTEDAIHEELQQEHTFAEIGSELVAKRVSLLDDVTISELVTSGEDALNTPRFQSKAGQMSIGRILKALGWEKFRAKRGGVEAMRWRRGANAAPKGTAPKPGVFSPPIAKPSQAN